jgi:hypothetical protein
VRELSNHRSVYRLSILRLFTTTVAHLYQLTDNELRQHKSLSVGLLSSTLAKTNSDISDSDVEDDFLMHKKRFIE